MTRKGVSFFMLLFLSPLAFGTVIPISSSIMLHSEVNAGLGLAADDDFTSQTSSLNTLGASVFAQAINGGSTATAESTASASWLSASAGQYSVHSKFTTGNLPYQSARVATGGDGLIYTFVSDVPATLTINYGITYAGSFLYGMPIYLEQTVNNVRLADFEFARSSSSGTLTFPVGANQAYSIEFYDGSNLNQFLPPFTSEVTGNFSYQIVPVPEPCMFAVMGLGAAILWRRKRPTPCRADSDHRNLW